ADLPQTPRPGRHQLARRTGHPLRCDPAQTLGRQPHLDWRPCSSSPDVAVAHLLATRPKRRRLPQPTLAPKANPRKSDPVLHSHPRSGSRMTSNRSRGGNTRYSNTYHLLSSCPSVLDHGPDFRRTVIVSVLGCARKVSNLLPDCGSHAAAVQRAPADPGPIGLFPNDRPDFGIAVVVRVSRRCGLSKTKIEGHVNGHRHRRAARIVKRDAHRAVAPVREHIVPDVIGVLLCKRANRRKEKAIAHAPLLDIVQIHVMGVIARW